MERQLKLAKIKDGKICLEGRILESPEIIALKTLNVWGGSNETEELIERTYKKILEESPDEADCFLVEYEGIIGFNDPKLMGLRDEQWYLHRAILYLKSNIKEG